MSDEEIQPEVPVKKKPGRKPRVIAEQPDFMILIEEMRRQHSEDLRAQQEFNHSLMEQSKQPSVLEQKKLDKDREEVLRRERAKVLEANRQEFARKMKITNCSHTSVLRGQSTHCWRAQSHTPNAEKAYCVPMCQRCNIQLPRIYVEPQQILNGMNFNEIPNLNVKVLLDWAERSGNIHDVHAFRKEHQIAA